MTTNSPNNQSFAQPSVKEIEAGMARAHVLRAEAFHGVLSSLAQGFAPRAKERSALAPRHVAGCHVGC